MKIPLLLLTVLLIASCSHQEPTDPDVRVELDGSSTVNIRLHLDSKDLSKMQKESPKELPKIFKDSIARLNRLNQKAKRSKKEEIETKDFATFKCAPDNCTIDLAIEDKDLPHRFLETFIEEAVRVALRSQQ